MTNRPLFKKRKKYSKKYFFFILFILIIFTILIIFYYNSKHIYFEVPSFNNSFYIVPDDRGGKKVLNLDKTSLHLNDEDANEIQIVNDSMLEYSIQFFASDNYNIVNKKLYSLTKNNYNNLNNQENLLNRKDFFIVVFNHEINKEYLLLYKNFTSRDLAFRYCSKYLDFLQKCLVVNAQNLN